MGSVTTRPDVTVVITGQERDEISQALTDAVHAMFDNGSNDAEHEALYVLVELVADLQIGSETSNFLFPTPDKD